MMNDSTLITWRWMPIWSPGEYTKRSGIGPFNISYQGGSWMGKYIRPGMVRQGSMWGRR